MPAITEKEVRAHAEALATATLEGYKQGLRQIMDKVKGSGITITPEEIEIVLGSAATYFCEHICHVMSEYVGKTTATCMATMILVMQDICSTLGFAERDKSTRGFDA